MIRAATPQDTPALMALAKETAMFKGDELDALASMVAEYFAGNLGEDHQWIIDDDDGLKGAACYAPETMARGVWNLTFIGVHDAARRQGRAARLLHFVEDALIARRQRLLLIETSGMPQFEPARALYRKHGYDEEGRVREFYGPGEDKLVFRKKLDT